MTGRITSLLRRLIALSRLRSDLADLAPAASLEPTRRTPDESNVAALERDLRVSLLNSDDAEVGDGQEDHS